MIRLPRTSEEDLEKDLLVETRPLSFSVTIEFAIDVSGSPSSPKPGPAEAQRVLFQRVTSWLSEHPSAIVLAVNLVDSSESVNFDGVMKLHLTVEEVDVHLQ